MHPSRALFLAMILLAVSHSWPTLALDHRPTRHIEQQFRIPGDPRTFSRHTFMPVEDERWASPESRELLAIVAGEIRREADELGYTKGPSGAAYVRELELLAKGHWPLTYITVAGDWQVLMHMAFAIRWDDSPLPWEARFLGDDTRILPEQIVSEFKVGIGSHEFPMFQHYTELSSSQNQDRLRLLSLLRYEMVGERTEFKFLSGREPTLLFLRELLHATSEFGLHKYSGRKPDEKVLETFKKALATFPVDMRTVKAIAQGLDSPHSEVMTKFLVKFLTDPSLQTYVANSGVYGHMSSEHQGEELVSARATLFQRRLKLPTSLYSFLEGAGIGPGKGTKLIVTDITAVPTAYFETIVLRSLDDVASLKNRPATYLDPEDWVPGSIGCATHLLNFERALYEFQHGPP